MVFVDGEASAEALFVDKEVLLEVVFEDDLLGRRLAAVVVLTLRLSDLQIRLVEVGRQERDGLAGDENELRKQDEHTAQHRKPAVFFLHGRIQSWACEDMRWEARPSLAVSYSDQSVYQARLG